MDPAIIGAIIGAIGAIVAACIGLIKLKSGNKRKPLSNSNKDNKPDAISGQDPSKLDVNFDNTKSFLPAHINDAKKFFERIQPNVDLQGLISEALSSMKPACIILLDIDGQNGINKRFGQTVGDKVIATMGSLVNQRHCNYSGRCGDDTFYLILLGQTLKKAKAFGTTLLKDIRNFDWDLFAHELFVTCSAGVAEFRIDESLEQTALRAAIGFRKAKSFGGNRLVSGPQHLSKIRIPSFADLVS